MVHLGQRLREHARGLGLSDAEVARRAGLSERRYGNYVTGAREPDLATLARICGVLDASPNDLLGMGKVQVQPTNRSRLVARLVAAANSLESDDLALAIEQVESLARHRRARAR
jgi:transcriptional regulator with XRE-family HTH domain